jgi:hypothetical protein
LCSECEWVHVCFVCTADAVSAGVVSAGVVSAGVVAADDVTAGSLVITTAALVVTGFGDAGLLLVVAGEDAGGLLVAAGDEALTAWLVATAGLLEVRVGLLDAGAVDCAPPELTALVVVAFGVPAAGVPAAVPVGCVAPTPAYRSVWRPFMKP